MCSIQFIYVVRISLFYLFQNVLSPYLIHTQLFVLHTIENTKQQSGNNLQGTVPVGIIRNWFRSSAFVNCSICSFGFTYNLQTIITGNFLFEFLFKKYKS